MASGSKVTRRLYSAKRAYHHGDLRRALLREALRQLRRRRPEELTLKALATAVGVSHTAPYRHFSNLHGLLNELIDQGFAELSAALTSAYEQAPAGTRQQFLDTGFAVVNFALRHSQQYQLMFSGNGSNHADELSRAPQKRAFGKVVEYVSNWQRAGLVRPADPTHVALALYAATHGIANLLASGQLRSRSVGDARKLADEIHATVLDGLRPTLSR